MAIIGIEKLYYAKITKDDSAGVVYGTPIYLPGIKEIGIKPKQNTGKLYAENKLWEQTTTLDSVDIEIETADLTNAQLADLLGHTISSVGGIIKDASDVAPYIALLYKATKTNNRARYGVLYKGKMQLPDDSAKGQEGKVDFQTPKMAATFQPLAYNNDWSYVVDSDDANAPANLDTTFFNTVLLPSMDTTVPTVTSVPIKGATGVAATASVVLTFTKAINVNTLTTDNIFLINSAGATIASTLTVSTDGLTVTLKPSSNLTAGAYTCVITKDVKTTANISLAAVNLINFTV